MRNHLAEFLGPPSAGIRVIAPDSKFIVLLVGKRTQEQTQGLVSDTQSRLRKGHLPALFSDGYDGDEPSILEAFGRRYAVPKTGLDAGPFQIPSVSRLDELVIRGAV